MWLVTTGGECTGSAEGAQLWAKWVVVQVVAGQPRPRVLPPVTTLLVATAVPQYLHMPVHALEDQPEDTGLLVVHQHRAPEGALILGEYRHQAEILLNDNPAARPNDTLALSVG